MWFRKGHRFKSNFKTNKKENGALTQKKKQKHCLNVRQRKTNTLIISLALLTHWTVLVLKKSDIFLIFFGSRLISTEWQ